MSYVFVHFGLYSISHLVWYMVRLTRPEVKCTFDGSEALIEHVDGYDDMYKIGHEGIAKVGVKAWQTVRESIILRVHYLLYF